MQEDAPILSETQGRVALIRLNRPRQMNALNDALMDALGDALLGFDAREDIGVILITGNDKAFAAGADIAQMRAGQRDQPLRPLLVEPVAAQFGALAVLIAKISARQQPAQTQIAVGRLAQQQQTVGPVAVGLVADKHIAARNRLDAFAARGLVELDQARAIGKVGQRECGHPVGFGGGDGFVHAQHPVRDGIFAVQTEMDKVRHGRNMNRFGADFTTARTVSGIRVSSGITDRPHPAPPNPLWSLCSHPLRGNIHPE